MPNHKSCAKRVKTSAKERLRNRAFRTKLRTAVRELRSETNKETATSQYKNVTKIIDMEKNITELWEHHNSLEDKLVGHQLKKEAH